MSTPAPGQRVYAIRDADEHNIYLFGFGQYVGNEIPTNAEGLAEHLNGRTNPKIVLDDGKVVWGCECWWGAEDQFESQVESRNVLYVDIIREREYQRSARKASFN